MTEYIKGLIEGYSRAISFIDIFNTKESNQELLILRDLLESKINLYTSENAKLIENENPKKG